MATATMGGSSAPTKSAATTMGGSGAPTNRWLRPWVGARLRPNRWLRPRTRLPCNPCCDWPSSRYNARRRRRPLCRRQTLPPPVAAAQQDKDNKLKNGMEFEGSEEQHVQLSTTERTFLAKDLPGQLSSKAQALVEALEGKRFDSFMDALRDTAEESGLLFKKLDERLEQSMLHSHHKDLIAQVSSETDPVSFLPKVAALLFLQAYNKALQAPGSAVGAVITLLKDKLPASTLKVLTEYHATTMKLLALQDAATGDEDDCTSDRMLEKQEDLEERLMPELKSLALGPSKEQ